MVQYPFIMLSIAEYDLADIDLSLKFYCFIFLLIILYHFLL